MVALSAGLVNGDGAEGKEGKEERGEGKRGGGDRAIGMVGSLREL